MPREVSERLQATIALLRAGGAPAPKELLETLEAATSSPEHPFDWSTYKALFERNPLPMWVFAEGDLRVLTVNAAALQTYGYSRDEFLALTILELRPPEDRPALLEHLKEPSEERDVRESGVWRHVTKSGEVRHVEIHSLSVVFGGAPARLVTAKDITERVESELRTAALEQRFRLIAESTSDVLWEWDLAAGRVWRSARVADLIGFTPPPASEHPRWWNSSIVHEDDREPLGLKVASALESGHQGWDVNYRLRRADGEVRWVRETATILRNDSGAPVRVLGGVTDETEARLSRMRVEEGERRFRALFETSPDGIVLCRDRMIELANDAFARIVRVASRHFVLGRDILDILGRQFEDVYNSLHQRTEDDTDRPIEYSLTVGEDLVHLQVSISHIVVGDHFLVQLIFHDATSERRAIREREEARSRLRLVSRSTQDSIWEWDIAEESLLWSENFPAQYLYDAASVAGTLDWWADRIHPRDRERVVGGLLRVGEGNESDHWEERYRFLKGDGTWAHVHDRGFLLRDSLGVPMKMVGAFSDLTPSIEHERRLREERERFRTAAGILSDIIYEYDPAGDRMSWHGHLDGVFQAPGGELETSRADWVALIHPESREEVSSEFERFAGEGGDFQARYRMVGADGQERRWFDRATVIRDPTGRVARVVGAITDETVLVESRAALDRMTRRVQTLFESDLIGLFIATMDGRLVDSNKSFLEMIGWTAEEVKAGMVRWDQLTAPEFADRDAKALGELRDRGSCIPFEKDFLRKDGSRIPILIGAEMIDGDEDEVLCFVSDLTELRQAREVLEQRVEERTEELRRQYERQSILSEIDFAVTGHDEVIGLAETVPPLVLRALGSSLGCGITLRDSSGGTYLASTLLAGAPSTTHRHVGWAELRPMTRWIFEEKTLLHIEDTSEEPLCEHPFYQEQGIAACLAIPIESGGDVVGALYCYNGEPRKYDSDEVEFLNAVGRRLAVAVQKVALVEVLRSQNKSLQEEIGQRRAAVLAMEEARAAAVRANTAKSEFLSRMSHELRTPLNAILGFAQLLDLGTLDAAQKEGLGHILTSGRHLLALINEVLDIARIEAGKMSVSPEPILLRAVVGSAIEMLRPQAQGREVAVHWELDGCRQTHVLADPSRLRQVLINVISNAIKYNRRGGEIRVHCEPSEGGRLVTLVIADTGIGIPRDKLQRLFTPFDRLGAEVLNIEGSGLGLALSKRLLDIMKGSIEVSSEPGRGTRVSIHLERSEAVEIASERTEREAKSDAGLPSLPSIPLKVLYVEDNDSNVTLVRRILSLSGRIELLVAESGERALEVLEKITPDIILLDVNLPGMSGMGVLTRIKADEGSAAIPVIAMSADASPGQIQRLLAAGAQRYLTKPINVRELLGVLKDTIKSMENTPNE